MKSALPLAIYFVLFIIGGIVAVIIYLMCIHSEKNYTPRPTLIPAVLVPQWLSQLEKPYIGAAMPDDNDKMKFVVNLACENVMHGTGGPFAAAIFDMENHTLLATGVNVVVPAHQSSAHAEMTAYSRAQNILRTHDLRGYMLVTSCEPCAMCYGATPWSGVQKMIYGATKAMAENAGFDEGDKGEAWKESLAKRGIEVIGPLLGEDANTPFMLYRQNSGVIY